MNDRKQGAPPLRKGGQGKEEGALPDLPGGIFDENWTVVPYGDGDSLVIHAGDEWRVCFMATPGESPGAMEQIAKWADLIAAAPRMYRALVEIARLRTELPSEIARKALPLPHRTEGETP